MNMLASYDVRDIQIQIHVESPKNKKLYAASKMTRLVTPSLTSI